MKTITIKIYDEFIDLFPGLKDPEGALHDVLMSSYADPDYEEVKESRMAVSYMLTNMHIEDAQPERKTGQWRPVQIGKWHGFECTACKVNREVPCSNSGIPQWKYCPECGAKMEAKHGE